MKQIEKGVIVKDKNWRSRVTVKRSVGNTFWDVFVDGKQAGDTTYGIKEAVKIGKRIVKEIDKGVSLA